MKKIINILALVVIVLGIGYIWQTNSKQNKSVEGGEISNEINQVVNEQIAKEPTATINIDFVFNDQRTETVAYEYPANASYSLFAITKGALEQKSWAFEWKDYGELGILVTKIDNTANGTDNKYWQYYINGQMPQLSAIKYFPQASDKVKWVFQESKY
ncbi:MAG: hypothetical protein C3F02_04230 [Parcubacteria group bacterium]|nr:MAG: hypothetical protein C3F02_04230 [Parcubacteria group bacterium]